MSSAIQTLDLAVGYRSPRSRSVVLENLNLVAHAGELICLLGPNGTGKSTLLRTIAKLQPALAGSVKLEGADLLHLSQNELARRLGVVLTERPLVGALTARRVVELGRYPYWDWSGRMTARDHEVVDWAIDAVGAESLGARDIMSLSDGERQRFMIARALAQEPSILVLDEPTAFLDVPSRVELMGLLRRLSREEGLAVVASSHDLELALRMADTLWLLSPENRVDAGTPEDLILAGKVAGAFPARTIKFQPEERAFRLVTEGRGSAIVRGEGLSAVLAAAVLEREGYEIVSDGAAGLTVIVASGASWELAAGESQHRGDSFATLAECVRALTGSNLRN